MGILDTIKANVDALSSTEEEELRAWLDARALAPDASFELTPEQEAILTKRLSEPAVFADENEIRAIFNRYGPVR